MKMQQSSDAGRKQPISNEEKKQPASNLEPEDKSDSRFGPIPMINNWEKAAVNVSERSTTVNILPEQKEEYVKNDPEGTIKQLTDHLFIRDGVFPAKNRTLQGYCVDKVRFSDVS
jgi:hypothetical protein